MQIGIVAGAQDGPLALAGQDEGERGALHLPGMDGDLIFRGHVEKHAAQPVVGERGQEIRHMAQLGAGEGGGEGVAAEGNRIVLGDRLLVPLGHFIRDQGHVDIGLANEERFHGMILAG